MPRKWERVPKALSISEVKGLLDTKLKGRAMRRDVTVDDSEAKKVPGLYFLGELIDVTGHLGGYNLHWAWASGHAAGQSV